MIAPFCLILISLNTDLIYGQEYIGLRTDNYSGSNGMLLNPASPLSGALPWDINIVAAGISANNNYIYAVDQNTISMTGSINEEIPVAFYHPQKVYAYENLFVQWPSAFVRINNIAVGVFFTSRSAGYLKSENYIPGVLSYDTIPFNVPTDFPAFTAGGINWHEIGVNGEIVLVESSERAIYAGANLKYLLGMDGMDFNNHQQFTYTKGDQSSTITPIDMDFSYSTNFGSSKMADLSNYKINGSGLGFDAGFFYEIKTGSYDDIKNPAAYSWKLGASLLDIGFIRFKRNSGDYHLSSGETISISTASLDSIDDLDEFNFTGSRNLYDNSSASQTNSRFSLGLPAAISLSADKNFGRGFFVNGLIVRRIPHMSSGLVARPNTIAISPRIEKRWVGFTVPVILYEDKYLHLGSAFRIGFLTVGSDNILSWFVKDDYTGSDIYAGIKINPFWLNKSPKSARQLECPKVWK